MNKGPGIGMGWGLLEDGSFMHHSTNIYRTFVKCPRVFLCWTHSGE